jgi:hypothetical protein
MFIVLLLTLAVMLAQTLEQAVQLRRDRSALDAQLAQQNNPIQEAQKIRTQLEAIAGDTAVLADAGNENAIRLRDFLRQQGVTIRPPATRP